MTVKKPQLALRLSERLGVSKKQAAEFLNAFVEEVTTLLKKGEKVNITGFGIFKVSQRKAREGINPKTGEKIKIPASKRPKFTPGKALKEAVK
jgi:nucleoid DNA-binding protein